MKSYFRILAINLLLLLPVLYTAEVFLRVRLGVEPRDTYLRLGWRPLMPVWMGEVASLQDQTGVPFLGGIREQNTFLCDDGYGSVVYKSDHLGFRSTSADYKGGVPYDVLIVGDSFMHGWCHPHSLAEHLRNNKRQVVNTAIAGSHPYQYSAVLASLVARPLPPRNVILGIYLGNDYGSCSGCLERYSPENPRLQAIYAYSKKLGMHIVNDNAPIKEYESKLRLLQEQKTSALTSESTWQILKLGELRRFILALVRPTSSQKGTQSPNPDVPINSTAVNEAISLLGRICSRSTRCKPVLVTIPSNEAGEGPSLRARITKVHSKIVDELKREYTDLVHIDLRNPPGSSGSCQRPLYDSPGRHLSVSGQHCLNRSVRQALTRSPR